MELIPQVSQFCTDGKVVYCAPYGSGHINRTYLVLDSMARMYILQMVNKNIFKNTEGLMQNILAVTTHLRKTANASREVLTLVPTKAGNMWLVDENGEFWRMYHFVSDSLCLQAPETPADFRESALAFGNFQRKLADFPAETLVETIPHFHDTPHRYETFVAAVKADVCGRAANVQREIEFALQRQEYAKTLMNLHTSGDLPLRVTHNDTKLNNVLLDRDTRKALCVIDLDTVMPGFSVNDFGDSIRFGASSAAEDETDLSKVEFLLPLYETYTEGFLATGKESLTACEIEHLRDGAKMMTLECGVRFLTDYLSGDTYFRTSREGHNLDRCRTQFKLVAGMEHKWDEMRRITR